MCGLMLAPVCPRLGQLWLEEECSNKRHSVWLNEVVSNILPTFARVEFAMQCKSNGTSACTSCAGKQWSAV